MSAASRQVLGWAADMSDAGLGTALPDQAGVEVLLGRIRPGRSGSRKCDVPRLGRRRNSWSATPTGGSDPAQLNLGYRQQRPHRSEPGGWSRIPPTSLARGGLQCGCRDGKADRLRPTAV